MSRRALQGSVPYEVRCEDETFQRAFAVHIQGQGVQVTQGSAVAPAAIMRLNVEMLYALSGWQLPLQTALEQGKVILEGDAETLKTFLS